MRRNKLLFLAAVLTGLCATLPAAPISGTFSMSGDVTVTRTTMVWNSDLSPTFTHDMFSQTLSAGSFAGEDGQNSVDDLNIASEPVGTAFADTPFITFDVIPGLPGLEINFIYAGVGGTSDCSAAPAVGQTCTPPNPGGSPFTFTNDPPPNDMQSTAQWVFTGVTSDGMSDWRGVFTSQFDVPFQSVPSAFAPGGSGTVTNSFGATITVIPTPEPAPTFMMATGAGLLLLSLMLRKWRRT